MSMRGCEGGVWERESILLGKQKIKIVILKRNLGVLIYRLELVKRLLPPK